MQGMTARNFPPGFKTRCTSPNKPGMAALGNSWTKFSEVIKSNYPSPSGSPAAGFTWALACTKLHELVNRCRARASISGVRSSPTGSGKDGRPSTALASTPQPQPKSSSAVSGVNGSKAHSTL